jgi:hypothetical protein
MKTFILTLLTGFILGMAVSYYQYIGQNIERGFMQSKVMGMMDVISKVCPQSLSKFQEPEAKK